MRESKYKNQNDNNRFPIVAGVAINVMIIFSIVFILYEGNNGNDGLVSGSSDPWIKLDPEEYQNLTYSTSASALEETNDQLSEMLVGDIQEVDSEDEDYTAFLIQDFEIGNVIYWKLSDSFTSVYLDANTGEIIFYSTDNWIDGSLSQSNIESQAYQIASQFCTVPSPPDRSVPLTSLETPLSGVGFESEETSTQYDYPYWYVEYDRLKTNIHAQDMIRLIINPNGYLHCYYKIWNMDLNGFSTSYSVTQTSAEATAITHAGPGSTVQSVEKRIVRPNEFWTNENEIVFGEDPKCVWEICVKDAEDNLRIYHIDGNLAQTISGGDFFYSYYEEE